MDEIPVKYHIDIVAMREADKKKRQTLYNTRKCRELYHKYPDYRQRKKKQSHDTVKNVMRNRLTLHRPWRAAQRRPGKCHPRCANLSCHVSRFSAADEIGDLVRHATYRLADGPR